MVSKKISKNDENEEIYKMASSLSIE